MISDYITHTLSVVGFIIVVIIPSLLATPFIVLRDLVCLCLPWGGRPSSDQDTDITETSDSATPAPADSDMKTSLKAGRFVAAATSVVNNGSQQHAYSWVNAAADPSHLGGIPRRIVLSTVGSFSSIVTSMLNRVKVHNLEKLQYLIHNRPKNTPLITVSNHMSTLDDPLMWGIWSLRCTEPKVCRWTLTAKDICFTNPYVSYFFRLGKCIPIDRWGSIHQDCIFEAIDLINRGEWLHTFPEGKIMQDHLPLRRLKWGVASIISRCTNPPIVLCIGLSGFEKVMPENHLFGKRAFAPLWGKNLSIVVGDPVQFDISALRREAEEAVKNNDPKFGADCLLHEEEEASTEGMEVNALVAQAVEAQKEKEAKIAAVGDEVTRRLYSEISSRLKNNLEELVFEAHRCTKERSR